MAIDGLSNFEELGRGGFAVVYSAYDSIFGRTVAVKVLNETDADAVRRFQRELEHMGGFDEHPGIITPHRAGVLEDGRPYVVMEYLSGGSLEDRLATSGPLDPEWATELTVAIADALSVVHAADILHRDIKPANILLTSQAKPKLSDFGIATLRSATLSQNALTPYHAPPEAFDQQYEVRSDLWSLASTLYTLIDGHPPFCDPVSDDLRGLVGRIIHQPTPSLAAARDLDPFFASALSKHPDGRPGDAREFVALLESVSPWLVSERGGRGEVGPQIHITVRSREPRRLAITGHSFAGSAWARSPALVAFLLMVGGALLVSLFSIVRSWYG